MNIRREIPTLILVTLITLLIWLYAEGRDVQATDDPISVPVRLVSTAGSDVVFRQEEMTLQATFRGASAQIDRLRRRLEGSDRPVELRIDMDSTTPETFETRQLLVRALSQYGVNVLTVSPSKLTVSIDRLVTRPATVRFDAAEVRLLEAAVVEPMQIEITAPSRQLDVIAADGALVFNAKLLRPLAELDTGVEHNVRAQIELPDNLLSPEVSPHVELSATEVMVTLTIIATESSVEPPSVPVWIEGPPLELNRFDITLDRDSALLKGVTITGPTDLIDQLGPPIAYLALTGEDLDGHAGKGPVTAEVIFHLPDGLRVDVDSRTVTFTVTRRDE